MCDIIKIAYKKILEIYNPDDCLHEMMVKNHIPKSITWKDWEEKGDLFAIASYAILNSSEEKFKDAYNGNASYYQSYNSEQRLASFYYSMIDAYNSSVVMDVRDYVAMAVIAYKRYCKKEKPLSFKLKVDAAVVIDNSLRLLNAKIDPMLQLNRVYSIKDTVSLINASSNLIRSVNEFRKADSQLEVMLNSKNIGAGISINITKDQLESKINNIKNRI